MQKSNFKKYVIIGFTLLFIFSITPAIFSTTETAFEESNVLSSGKETRIGQISSSQTIIRIANFIKKNYDNVVTMDSIKDENE